MKHGNRLPEDFGTDSPQTVSEWNSIFDSLSGLSANVARTMHSRSHSRRPSRSTAAVVQSLEPRQLLSAVSEPSQADLWKQELAEVQAAIEVHGEDAVLPIEEMTETFDEWNPERWHSLRGSIQLENGAVRLGRSAYMQLKESPERNPKQTKVTTIDVHLSGFDQFLYEPEGAIGTPSHVRGIDITTTRHIRGYSPDGQQKHASSARGNFRIVETETDDGVTTVVTDPNGTEYTFTRPLSDVTENQSPGFSGWRGVRIDNVSIAIHGTQTLGERQTALQASLAGTTTPAEPEKLADPERIAELQEQLAAIDAQIEATSPDHRNAITRYTADFRSLNSDEWQKTRGNVATSKGSLYIAGNGVAQLLEPQERGEGQIKTTRIHMVMGGHDSFIWSPDASNEQWQNRLYAQVTTGSRGYVSLFDSGVHKRQSQYLRPGKYTLTQVESDSGVRVTITDPQNQEYEFTAADVEHTENTQPGLYSWRSTQVSLFDVTIEEEQTLSEKREQLEQELRTELSAALSLDNLFKDQMAVADMLSALEQRDAVPRNRGEWVAHLAALKDLSDAEYQSENVHLATHRTLLEHTLQKLQRIEANKDRMSGDTYAPYWMLSQTPDYTLLTELSGSVSTAINGSQSPTVDALDTEIHATGITEAWVEGDSIVVRFSNPGAETQLAVGVENDVFQLESIQHPDGAFEQEVRIALKGKLDTNRTQHLHIALQGMNEDGSMTPVGMIHGKSNEHELLIRPESKESMKAGIDVLSIRGPNILVAVRSPYEKNIVTVEGRGFLHQAEVEASGMDSLRTAVVTFNTQNPKGHYRVFCNDKETGYRFGATLLSWNPETGVLEEVSGSMDLTSAELNSNESLLAPAQRQLFMQSQIDSMDLHLPVLRQKQSWDLFRQSRFYIDDSNDKEIIAASPLKGHPDAGGTFRQSLGVYQAVVGDLLQAAARIAVAAWNGDSQQEALEFYEMRYRQLNSGHYLAELAIDFGIHLPSAAAIRDEGIALAKQQIGEFMDNQKQEDKVYARGSYLAGLAPHKDNAEQAAAKAGQSEVKSERSVVRGGIDIVDPDDGQLVFGNKLSRILEGGDLAALTAHQVSIGNIANANSNHTFTWVEQEQETSAYYVSRPLQFNTLGWAFSHNFIVTDAKYLGDPDATVISFGNNDTGHVGMVDYCTENLASDTTHLEDREAWLSLANDKNGRVDFVKLDVSSNQVRQTAFSVIEDNDYAMFSGVFGANSNSAAHAIANNADTSVTDPSPRLALGAGNHSKIRFGFHARENGCTSNIYFDSSTK